MREQSGKCAQTATVTSWEVLMQSDAKKNNLIKERTQSLGRNSKGVAGIVCCSNNKNDTVLQMRAHFCTVLEESCSSYLWLHPHGHFSPPWLPFFFNHPHNVVLLNVHFSRFSLSLIHSLFKPCSAQSLWEECSPCALAARMRRCPF